MSLIEGNAFGVFAVLYDDVDPKEYARDPRQPAPGEQIRESFSVAFARFREVLLDSADAVPFGNGVVALDLGNALYFEVGDGDHTVDPITWSKSLSLALEGFRLSVILTHGHRSLDAEANARPEAEQTQRNYRLLRVAHRSEPLKRAVLASALCNATNNTRRWTPALYVDTLAVQALGKTPKNQPTLLRAADSSFYRLSLKPPAS